MTARTDASADLLIGDHRDNVIAAGDGDDHLYGFAGDDVLLGGSGNDHLIGGTGADILIGGDGDDTVSYAGAANGVTIDLGLRLTSPLGNAAVVGLQTAGVDSDATGDVIASCETIVGSAHADVFKSDGSGVTFIGNGGGDSFYLCAGDTAVGGAGIDKFYLSTTQLDANTAIGEDNWYLNAVTLSGLDAEDQIFIDGVRYEGATVEISAAPVFRDGNPVGTDAGFPWQYTLESTSAYVGTQTFLNLPYGSMLLNDGTRPIELQDYGNIGARDQFRWVEGDGSTGGTGQVDIVKWDNSHDANGFFVQGPVTNALSIRLEDFHAGDADLDYDWFSETTLFDWTTGYDPGFYAPPEPWSYNPVPTYLNYADASYMGLFA